MSLAVMIELHFNSRKTKIVYTTDLEYKQNIEQVLGCSFK